MKKQSALFSRINPCFLSWSSLRPNKACAARQALLSAKLFEHETTAVGRTNSLLMRIFDTSNATLSLFPSCLSTFKRPFETTKKSTRTCDPKMLTATPPISLRLSRAFRILTWNIDCAPASARMSAQDTVLGQTASKCALISSMTSYPASVML